MKEWFLDNLFIIIPIGITVIMGVMAFILLTAFGGDSSTEFDIVQWVANPANPASPLHNLP